MNPSDDTKHLLRNAFDIYTDKLPIQACKAEWKKENIFGFLMGVAEYGHETHVNELNGMLQSIPQVESLKETYLEEMQGRCIDRFYDYYIRPFKKQNKRIQFTDSDVESSRSVSTHKSRDSSQLISESSASTLGQFSRNKKIKLIPQPSRKQFKKALIERDGVCLVCWLEDFDIIKTAHIIPQGSDFIISEYVKKLMKDAGIHSMNQVQNGLLLCPNCYSSFDKLNHYIDYVDMKLVVKVVNYSNDPSNWEMRMNCLKAIRDINKKYLTDNRIAVENNGEMALYFNINNQELQPSIIALEMHKRACLIWRMAGGYESDDEEIDEDESDPVIQKEEMIIKWIASVDKLSSE